MTQVIQDIALIVIDIFRVLLVLYIFMSYVPALRAKNFFYQLNKIFSQILDPIRKLIPPVGGLDFSPIALLILISIARKILIIVL